MTKDYFVLTPTEDIVVRILDNHKDGLSISAISTKVRLARTSIYNAIRSLSQKHLVTKDGFTYSLHEQLHKKSLRTISAPDQIHALMEELLRLKKGEIIHSIESDEEIRELFKSPREMLLWQKKIAKRKIVLKGIGTKSALRILKKLASDEFMKHIARRSGAARFTDEHIKASCTLVSFRDSVVFFSRRRKLFYRIDNSEISKFVQSIIDLLYNTLEYQKIV